VVKATPLIDVQQSEQYNRNFKELSFNLKCDFQSLYQCIPNLNEMLNHCGFDVGRIKMLIAKGETDISYVPKLFVDESQNTALNDAYNFIIAGRKYDSLELIKRKDSLLLLILLLHDSYFVDNNDLLLSKQNFNGSFHSMNIKDYPKSTQDLIKGKEVATLLEIILAFKKSENPINMQIGNKGIALRSTDLKYKVVAGIEKALLESTFEDVGLGLALVLDFIAYQESGNPQPLLNKSIALIFDSMEVRDLRFGNTVRFVDGSSGLQGK
jgi:hypothetical protein